MPVLRVEHRIADLDTWLQDFASRALVREQAGVTAVQVFQSEDDPHYIVENLFFDTDDAAICGNGCALCRLLHPIRGGYEEPRPELDATLLFPVRASPWAAAARVL